eukprot:5972421-Pleurochrysis_carterae.AAC.1
MEPAPRPAVCIRPEQRIARRVRNGLATGVLAARADQSAARTCGRDRVRGQESAVERGRQRVRQNVGGGSRTAEAGLCRRVRHGIHCVWRAPHDAAQWARRGSRSKGGHPRPRVRMRPRVPHGLDGRCRHAVARVRKPPFHRSRRSALRLARYYGQHLCERSQV